MKEEGISQLWRPKRLPLLVHFPSGRSIIEREVLLSHLNADMQNGILLDLLTSKLTVLTRPRITLEKPIRHKDIQDSERRNRLYPKTQSGIISVSANKGSVRPVSHQSSYHFAIQIACKTSRAVAFQFHAWICTCESA